MSLLQQENAKLKLEIIELKNGHEDEKNIMQQQVNEYDSMMRLAGIDIDDLRQSIQGRTIGPEGGTIEFFSYKISFPKGAVDRPTATRFYVSDDIDNLNLPPGLIPISLPLHCAPGGCEFNKPVNVKIPIWCGVSDSCDRPVSVQIYKKQRGGQWKFYYETPLTDSGFVSFTSKSFCKIAPMVSKKDIDVLTFVLSYFLFQNNLGNFASVLFVSSDKQAKKLEKNWNRAGYKVIYPSTTTQLVKSGQNIKISLISKEPQKYKFEGGEDTTLSITSDFYEMNLVESFSFRLNPKNPGSSTLDFDYTVGKKRYPLRVQYSALTEPESATDKYENKPSPSPLVSLNFAGGIQASATTVMKDSTNQNENVKPEGPNPTGVIVKGGGVADVHQS